MTSVCNVGTAEFALNTPPPMSRFWLLTRGGGIQGVFEKIKNFKGMKERLLKIGLKRGGDLKRTPR